MYNYYYYYNSYNVGCIFHLLLLHPMKQYTSHPQQQFTQSSYYLSTTKSSKFQNMRRSLHVNPDVSIIYANSQNSKSQPHRLIKLHPHLLYPNGHDDDPGAWDLSKTRPTPAQENSPPHRMHRTTREKQFHSGPHGVVAQKMKFLLQHQPATSTRSWLPAGD